MPRGGTSNQVYGNTPRVRAANKVGRALGPRARTASLQKSGAYGDGARRIGSHTLAIIERRKRARS